MNNPHSLGYNELLIGSINMMVLICKTANGLESDFLEIHFSLGCETRKMRIKALLECLNTAFTLVFPVPSFPTILKRK